MEERIYNNVGNVLQLNKAGELIQKRMKAVKVCDGLYATEPDKSGYTQFICELNGVVWLDCKAAENRIADGIKLMPGYFDKIKAGCFDGENIQEFKREISRRINHPDSPAVMELKQPERKKAVPLPEGAKKVSVYMFKGCSDEMTDKKVVITEVAPHVYTYAYKLKKYGERVKIIFEIDDVYFQGHDTGAYVLEREDFTEICTKAYKLARQNVADGAANGMAYFIEVQKRIDAATPTETPRISTETAEVTNVSADGDNAENEPQKHISEVLKEAERNYQCVKSETLRTVREADGKWHTYFMDDEIGTDLDYDQINHIPAARTAQAAEEVAEIRRYLNRLNGNHIADADYYLAEMRDGIRQAEAARRKKNTDAEGEKAADTKEMSRYKCPNYADYAFERGWSIENTDFDPHSGVLCMIHFDPSDEKYVCGCLWQINSDKPNYTEHRRFKTLKGAQNYGTKRMGMKLKYQTLTVNYSVTPSEPPQPPTTPTDEETIKPQEKRAQTARKEPKRTIQIFLIVQRPAYHFREVTKMTVPRFAKSVPRGCFTGWSPPIRGDCVIV